MSDLRELIEWAFAGTAWGGFWRWWGFAIIVWLMFGGTIRFVNNAVNVLGRKAKP